MKSGLTCLVVDDEQQIRRAVRNHLRDEFDSLLEAANAEEALDVAAAARPALVVLDLALPDRPGITVCRELRHWSSAPIIVLSALHSESEKVSLLDAGADDYMTKP
jgi:two-component system KDP operon response regulator KdpE